MYNHEYYTMCVTRGCNIDVRERIEITDGTWWRRMV